MKTANRLSILLLRLGYLMPGGYIPRLEIMERECWKFLDWRLNSDNDPRLHGQPSSSMMCPKNSSTLVMRSIIWFYLLLIHFYTSL